jgi:nitrite reductase/ring-hydroxylating ferredoxin subunit
VASFYVKIDSVMVRRRESGKENPYTDDTVKVASVQEIKPGKRKVVSVRGIEILLLNLDGEFYAVSNVCPHKGYPLTYGPIYGDVIICPNHAWMFNVKTGECMTKPSCPIKTYRVFIEGKAVKIRL